MVDQKKTPSKRAVAAKKGAAKAAQTRLSNAEKRKQILDSLDNAEKGGGS